MQRARSMVGNGSGTESLGTSIVNGVGRFVGRGVLGAGLSRG